MGKKMTIGLCSGGIDKLTAAGIIIGGAVADDMQIEVFILLNAARSFKKEFAENPKKLLQLSEHDNLRIEFIESLDNLKIDCCIESFRKAKKMGDLKIHVCGTAGKIWGANKLEDFVDIVDDICGISEYVTSIEEADIQLFI
jgi:peroxiredoxin family protein